MSAEEYSLNLASIVIYTFLIAINHQYHSLPLPGYHRIQQGAGRALRLRLLRLEPIYQRHQGINLGDNP
jgi:hypothetical protein